MKESCESSEDEVALRQKCESKDVGSKHAVKPLSKHSGNEVIHLYQELPQPARYCQSNQCAETYEMAY
eukprot:6029094-Amphidinium_carterae.1